MSWQTFFGVSPTPDAAGWRVPVTDDLTGGAGQLFGGCAFGASVAALTTLTGRPPAWATAQFLTNAFPPEVVELEATVVVAGRNFAQGRVVGRVGEREVLTVLASLGGKSFEGEGRWVVMADVEPPERCPGRLSFGPTPGGLHHRIEQRVAVGDWGDERFSAQGSCRVWTRMADGFATTPAGLAVVADFLPLGVRAALGRELFGASLDNTIRYVERDADPERGWVLADLHVDAVHDGIGHGTVHLWSESGLLLAVASQTCSLRDLTVRS